MIFKRTSLLLRCLNKNASLFDKWKKRYLNDGSIEEIIYEKDNIRIIFQEDVREHIVNFFVLDSQKRIAKVYFREVFLGKNLTNTDEFKKSILELGNKNNIEEQEIKIYIDFLKRFKLI